MNNYTIYIKESCDSCQKVLNFFGENALNVEVVNLDKEVSSRNLLIVPALFNGDRLIGYGENDIRRILAD